MITAVLRMSKIVQHEKTKASLSSSYPPLSRCRHTRLSYNQSYLLPWSVFLFFHPPVSPPSICENLAAARSAGVRLLHPEESKCRKRGRLLFRPPLPVASPCSPSLSNTRRLLNTRGKNHQRERRTQTQEVTKVVLGCYHSPGGEKKRTAAVCVVYGGVLIHGGPGAWKKEKSVPYFVGVWGCTVGCAGRDPLIILAGAAFRRHAREGCFPWSDVTRVQHKRGSVLASWSQRRGRPTCTPSAKRTA